MSDTSGIPQFSKLIEIDPYLKDFQSDFEYQQFQDSLNEIETSEEGGLDKFSQSYHNFGLNVDHDNLVISVLRNLIDNWNPDEFMFEKEDYGKWSLKIPPTFENKPRIEHMTRYKLCIETQNGDRLYRLSPWAKYTIQNKETHLFEAYLWRPKTTYQWKYDWLLVNEPREESLRIYEAHVGISSEGYQVASYSHFKEKVIPHILYLGYNTIQLMAIMEHAYYASFGYQVTSFFAVSRLFSINLVGMEHPTNLKI
ncbi:1,4-alpha-glucan-branching enzyme [Thelohanellus kitauei]|uniref:1,4-alpha-glucan-branching enzyme n=1 Tax=Thelohanellus kitauei TaxID=669202 RepID=A0A0C2MEX6_THEKT|nr:1,4-alpha-glucan-branching enzyme [Thelohanellus kitauei]